MHRYKKLHQVDVSGITVYLKDQFYIYAFVYYERKQAGVVELVDTQDLKKIECLIGNDRSRTVQIRGNLLNGNPEPSPRGKV